jgi:branched-chain amino acid transport system permease protein
VSKLLQTLVDGIVVGSLYALVALGYTMVYGILRFINFAHIDVFMLEAWVSFVIARYLRWGQGPGVAPWYAGAVTLGLATAFCGLVGYLIERLAYRPLRNAPRLNVLITAIGVSLLLENAGQSPHVFGADPAPRPDLLPDLGGANELLGRLSIAGVSLQMSDVLCVATAILLMVALEFLVFHTRFGLAMRAVSFDHRVAALMGVNVSRVISITFVAGSCLAAAAGFLQLQRYPTLQQPAHTAWVMLGLKAFVAAVVGGIGNIRGAMLGGLLIGLIEFFGATYLSPDLRDVYVFTILIAVLLVRPSGILGRRMVEKV